MGFQPGIAGIGANLEGIVAGIEYPCVLRLVEAGEVALGDGETEGLALAGLEHAGLAKGDELMAQPTHGGIDLYHLLAGAGSGVGDLDAEGEVAIGLGTADSIAEAKGIGHRAVEGIKVAVSHVHTLDIVDVVYVLNGWRTRYLGVVTDSFGAVVVVGEVVVGAAVLVA